MITDFPESHFLHICANIVINCFLQAKLCDRASVSE